MRAILMFHSVEATGSVLSIAPEQLRSLVGAIRRSGHRIVPLRELLDSNTEPDQIALTFDDGMRSLHEHALPILQREQPPDDSDPWVDPGGGDPLGRSRGS